MDVLHDFLLYLLQFQRLIIAPVLITAWGMEKRRYFILRAIAALVVYILACDILAFYIYPFKIGGYVDPSYFFMLAIAVLCLLFCFKGEVKNIIYYTMAGYIAQNLAYNLLKIVIVCSGVEYRGLAGCCIQIAIYAAVFVAYYFAFARKLRKYPVDWSRVYIILISAFIILMVYVLSSFFDLLEDAELLLQIAARSYAMICCLLELMLQLSVLDNDRQKKENQTLEAMLKVEAKQHESFRSNLDFLNMKMHDIKHLIAAYRGSGMMSNGGGKPRFANHRPDRRGGLQI